MPYQDAFQLLVDIGLVDVILPFILVFTITYAVLQNTQVFGTEINGKPKKKINAMVAFVMGFFAVLTVNLIGTLNIILTYFVLILVIGLLLALVFGIAGAEVGSKNKIFVALMTIFIVIFVFLGLVRAGIIKESAFWSGFILPLAIMAAIVFIIYYIFKKEKKKSKPAAATGGPQQGGRASAQGQQEL